MPSKRSWVGCVLLAWALVTCGSSRQEAAAPHWAPQDWQQRVVSQIQAAEYRIRKSGDGYEAGNRAHGLRARWTGKGVSVEPRTEDRAGLTLALTSFGRARQQPLRKAEWVDAEARADDLNWVQIPIPVFMPPSSAWLRRAWRGAERRVA